MTVDYRALDAATEPLTAAVPSIADVTTQLNAASFPWMAVIDVKDMFFMIPLCEADRERFAFTWQGLQHTFTRLPQGFKHSPTIAHAMLTRE